MSAITVKEIREYLRSPEKPNLWYFPFQVAQDLSDLAAILLYDIYNRTRNKRDKRDGFVWTYDAMRVFAANHPYASEAGIRKAFLALEQDQFIRIEKTGKYNRKKYDEKWWYALTEKGRAAVIKRRMRYEPDITASLHVIKSKSAKEIVLGIPKGIILDDFRYHLHENGGEGYVTLNPAEMKMPYHPKTIGRHLDELVELGILERDVDDKHRYCVVEEPVGGPLTVPVGKLLPPIEVGELALLTAPSGTAKTSFGTFLAVQHAVAGERVVYITLEEPAINIVHRMYAGEYGVVYSDLHQRKPDALNEVRTKQEVKSARTQTMATNLRVVDCSGTYPTAKQIQSKIVELQEGGFDPTLVIIDQLEFASTGNEEIRENVADDGEEADADDEDMNEEGVERGVPVAQAFAETFHGRDYKMVVLHQVEGSPRSDFGIQDVAGGHQVTDCFDVVLGIGRTNDAGEGKRVRLCVSSLKPNLAFESVFDADFAHMRFRPKK